MWLRASSDWQFAIDELIQRAHSIVLILPPGEEIRDSVKWEIGRITHRDLQSRVMIVLPPPDRNRQGYLKAHSKACSILAAFEALFGEVDDADPLKIQRYNTELSNQAIVTRLARKNIKDNRELQLQSWSLHKTKRDMRAAVRTYSGALAYALASIGQELSTLAFEDRYPWPLPPLPTFSAEGLRDLRGVDHAEAEAVLLVGPDEVENPRR